MPTPVAGAQPGVGAAAKQVAEHASSLAKLELELRRDWSSSSRRARGRARHRRRCRRALRAGFLFATVAAALAIVLDTWLASVRDRRAARIAGSSARAARRGRSRSRTGDREAKLTRRLKAMAPLASTPEPPTRCAARSKPSESELAKAVEQLRDGLGEATDVAAKLRSNLPMVAAGALGAGFFLAGGIGATMRFFARKGRES